MSKSKTVIHRQNPFSRATRVDDAQDTISICKAGHYSYRKSKVVSIVKELQYAILGTVHHRHEDATQLLQEIRTRRENDSNVTKERFHTIFEVTNETSNEASHRLRMDHPCILNFASAKNPGGGFLRGAKAQEEDIVRTSGLYPCLISKEARGMYDHNRALIKAASAAGSRSAESKQQQQQQQEQQEEKQQQQQRQRFLYGDGVIFSPLVPFFKEDKGKLLPSLDLLSVITAPAPNAGQARKFNISEEDLEMALRRRIQCILSVALYHNQRVLILGAFGCGVFRNDPYMVSRIFFEELVGNNDDEHDDDDDDNNMPFVGAFEKIVFGIPECRSDRSRNYRAFLRTFESVIVSN